MRMYRLLCVTRQESWAKCREGELETDTYTKLLVGVGPSKVVLILEDLVRTWCEQRFSLCNVNGGSGGNSCVGDGEVYLTIQEVPFTPNDIQVCVLRTGHLIRDLVLSPMDYTKYYILILTKKIQ